MPDTAALIGGGVRRYGRFGTRPTRVNPLDEFAGLQRTLRQFRLKEWIGFTLVHPDLYSSLIMQDAHYLASSEIYAFYRGKGVLYQHAANARGGSLGLPAEFSGRCTFQRPGYSLTYDFVCESGSAATPGDPRQHVIRFDIAATSKAPAFQGELRLDAGHASAPLSVSSRLSGGGRMYTHKAIFPAQGTLRVGDETFTFDSGRDLAILDEHKSLLPYQTSWLWGTFALHTVGGLAGANFASRASAPGAEEESCIWTPDGCEPLADITFRPQSADPLVTWDIRSADGRLGVIFEPEGRKEVRHQLGVFAIDYFQLFGHYRGTLAGSPVEGVHGVCESMRARM